MGDPLGSFARKKLISAKYSLALFYNIESSYYKNLKKLLEDLFASSDGESHPIHCYSADDLIRATNNFSPSRIVKQYYIRNWSNEDRDRFCVIRDIVISLQMSNHENVLKLLGCCLEFLYQCWCRNTQQKEFSTLMEIKSYYHGTLDCVLQSKLLVQFHISIPLLPEPSFIDVEDAVGGTPGYLDPSCMRSGRISEKTDVYNFGVLLLLQDFLNLALLCTRDRIESRPDMVDVARELVRIEEFVLPS
ncbi:hypothetical protein DVH24_007772 [Malus domestica]|uniref:Protein kinase domain-containing protein n=1 Tax=Malus domestica TaxID=3750 RepID=A0A498JQV1_MALDO|nr:hypothetical protein DVH24_007772 [Malus domestica]